MISNPERTVLISSVGWVDGDALWRFDVPAARSDRLPFHDGARYLSLHSSASAHFAVGHHFDGARFEITVHSFSDPTSVRARAMIDDRRTEVAGDSAAWRDVPLLYVAYLGFEPWKDFVLLKISAGAAGVAVQRLEWYDHTYDKGYQGVLSVLELAGEDAALVSVQRSSQLILQDLKTGRKKRAVDLGGRGGNPIPRQREGSQEIWASDYDTLVVISREDWRILRSARLQGAAVGTQQFIGDYSFAPDGATCVIARPFSGDAVEVDSTTLKVTRSVRLGRQPLELVALPGAEVLARDWKTGDVLRGTLKRRWFAG